MPDLRYGPAFDARFPQSIGAENAEESKDTAYEDVAKEVASYASDLFQLAAWTTRPSASHDLPRMRDLVKDLGSALADLMEAAK